MIIFKKISILFFAIALTACGTMWEVTKPERTALEQMLLSTATERAASRLTTDYKGNIVSNLPQSLKKTFIETKDFDGYDKKYAQHAIRRYFLDAGVQLVDDVKQADTIAEIAAGALSIDTTGSLVGIPAMGVPVPFAGQLEIPEIPLIYKKEVNRGLAKFSLSLRDARTGRFKSKSFFTIGTAEFTKTTYLLFFDFVENDLNLPQQYESSKSPF